MLVSPALAFNVRPLPALSGERSRASVSMGVGRYCLDSMSYVVDKPMVKGMGDVTPLGSSMSPVGSGSFLRCDEDSCETIELEPITQADVEECQAKWANAIQTISKTYLEEGDYIQAAGDAAAELYGYGHMNVLFKPTKAADEPFRPTGESAMSYFVGGSAVENGLEEDAGFAINGGKGWDKVVFDNHQVRSGRLGFSHAQGSRQRRTRS